MTYEEEMERRANHNVVEGNEEYSFCLSCADFVYLDEADRCMRCGKRNVIWRPIPAYPTNEMSRQYRRDILAAVAVCVVLGGLVLAWIFK